MRFDNLELIDTSNQNVRFNQVKTRLTFLFRRRRKKMVPRPERLNFFLIGHKCVLLEFYNIYLESHDFKSLHIC